MHTPEFSLQIQSMGDYIGVESCDDFRTDLDSQSEVCNRKSKTDRLRVLTEKAFPPPIPWLARAENLHCHMPWILRRYYSGDGRLIITEERARHHEYFRTRRLDGRLTLQLVHLDDDDDFGADADDIVEEENVEGLVELGEGEKEGKEDKAEIHSAGDCDVYDNEASGIIDGGDLRMGMLSPENRTALAKDAMTTTVPDTVAAATGDDSGGGCGIGKCYDYRKVRSNPYLFGMPLIPAIRPVHI